MTKLINYAQDTSQIGVFVPRNELISLTPERLTTVKKTSEILWVHVTRSPGIPGAARPHFLVILMEKRCPPLINLFTSYIYIGYRVIENQNYLSMNTVKI